MILKSLKLHNIRSYIQESIRFPEGTVLLSGDIGSGKSTLLLGIEFALFGIRRHELTGPSLLRYGQKKGSVELCFQVDGVEVIIKRTLKKFKEGVVQDSGFIIVDGKKTEGTPVELKSRVLELLGYPQDLLAKAKSLIYRYTVYTPQEGMKQIITERPEVRLDTLRKVFGMDKYKVIRENTALVLRHLRKRSAKLEGAVEDLPERLQQKKERMHELKSLEISIQEKEPVLQNLRKKIEERKDTLKKLERKIQKLEEIKGKNNIVQARLHEKKKQMESMAERMLTLRKRRKKLSEKLEGFLDVAAVEDEAPLEEAVRALNQELNAFNQARSILKEKLSSLQDQLLQAKKELSALAQEAKKSIVLDAKISALQEKVGATDKLQDKINALRRELEEINKEMERARLQREQAVSQRMNIEKLRICPVCRQEISFEHRHTLLEKEARAIAANDKELRLHEEAIREKKGLLAAMEKKMQGLREKESLLQSYLTEKKLLEKSLDMLVEKRKYQNSLILEQESLQKSLDQLPGAAREKLEKQILERKERLSILRESNKKAREKLSLLDRLKEQKEEMLSLETEMRASQGAVFALEQKKVQIRQILEKHTGLPRQFAEEKKAKEALLEDQKILEIKLAKLEQEKRSLARVIREIEEEIKKKQGMQACLKQMQKLQVWLSDYFLNLMITMEKHIMLSIYSEFNALLKEWFALLIDPIDIRLDREFSPLVIQDGYETDIEHLSGGERTSVALAYRLALNKVLNDLISEIKTKDLIMLDEPTDGFSTEQLDRVRELFSQLDMTQVILVSHEQKLETFVEHIIKITKTDHTSRILA